ncbi:transcriptional antiterminator, BglG family [Peptostreptococcus russellii]|uniref:Transcriptional antiterminator, BglG family n=1 Tax=Peptostreptococcus russellii TaxID=215200 RepID=A0A1H8G6E2_9FIRM|nr:PRD domain-containing protein [Peptostreptococcus russellii]SEN39325.1 transcriptional antiterminator, BglG family [Peptostreptococcus russellii]
MDFYNFESRELRLLNILEGSQIVKESYLKSLFSVSLKTINNDVKALNGLFKDLAVIRHDKERYSMFIIDLEKYLLRKNEIYKSRIDFNSVKIRMSYIFVKLATNKSYIMDDLTEEMSISKSTLNSDISKLKQVLKPYRISIESKTNKGIWLEGSEIDIRFCVMENMFRYAYKENLFEISDEARIKEILKKYDVETSLIKSLMKYLTVSIDRYQAGFLVEMNDNDEEILDNYYLSIVDEISDYIKEKYLIKLPDEEKAFISICFITSNISINIRKLEDNLDNYTEYNNLVENILNDIEEVYGVNIDRKYVNKEFMYHLFFMIKRIQYGIRSRNELKEKIKEKYVISYKMAKTASKTIERNYPYKVCDDEVAFLAMYFELFVNNMNSKKSLNALLISDSSNLCKKLMIQEIKKQQGGNINITHTSSSELDRNLDEYDFVISTIRKDIDTQAPVIYQDEILDISYVCRRIDALRILGKDITLVRGLDSILISSLTEETFYIANSKKTYSENIGNVLDDLYEKNIIDEEFRQTINQKIKSSASLFTKKIAVPHAVNKSTDDIVVSMIVSKNGTSDYPDLRLIILLGIPEEADSSTLLVRLYEEITTVIRDEKFIEGIGNVEDYHRVVDYFIHNSNNINDISNGI